MARPLRIGALISGGGSNLQAIIEACAAKQIDGHVVFVGSDNPEAQGLERARGHGIATFVVDYKAIFKEAKGQSLDALLPEDFDLKEVLAMQSLMPAAADREKMARYFGIRAVAEAALLNEMAHHPFDLLVLAGFMRVLTPYFIDRVNTDPSLPRIMNIHPAILPSFPGTDGYGDTYRYGCKVGGCTVHFVDYGEDTGAIIGQKAFEIAPGDTMETVRKKGLKLEWELYPVCIQLFAKRHLKVLAKSHRAQNGTVTRRKVVEIVP
ncbi:MAG: phosphoribosylglycinamide formyltransferase [Thermodesulfobacteriota bacterium]|nr:phosphoribosylglycinamide formyltransferase [Thermodesulfobacteriota bacterium]